MAEAKPAWEQHIMSDENTTEPTVEETPEAPAKEIDWVAEARKWEKRAKDSHARVQELEPAQARLAEIEEASKTAEQKQAEEMETLRAKAAKLEEDLAKKDREVLVQKVAATKGVKPRYLFGDTEEELLASADEYLEDLKGIAPERPTGIIPSAGTGDPKAEASTLNEVRERAKAFAGKK